MLLAVVFAFLPVILIALVVHFILKHRDAQTRSHQNLVELHKTVDRDLNSGKEKKHG